MDRQALPKFCHFKQFKELNGRRAPDLHGSAAIITLAVDELSYVRSTLGYAAAEQVLELCAERLVCETRENDIVIALGGDTFAVILRDLSETVVVRDIAVRLIERSQRSYLVEGHLVDIEIHGGIAFGSNRLDDFEDSLCKSSLALRAARSNHSRGPCFFEPSMENRLVLEQALIRDLRRALPLRQFTLHYQPQVDLLQRKVIGVEALLRWQHPVRGPVSPAVFIPIAEATGAIHSLGAWVLRTACKHAATLPEDISIAVNVSPLQLRNPDFVQGVREALCAAKIPGSRLEIEITEGILLDTADATFATLQSLHDMGIRFAIDDFGTGYSSLGQIGKFPFHTIKIDRSLVGHDSKHRAVVRAIVALANGLGMKVLVEGVETEQELRALKADGCSMFQGYLFGKPVAANQLTCLFDQIHTSEHLVPVGVLPDAVMERPRTCLRQFERSCRQRTRG